MLSRIFPFSAGGLSLCKNRCRETLLILRWMKHSQLVFSSSCLGFSCPSYTSSSGPLIALFALRPTSRAGASA
jgi:hypothetical protein